MSLPERGGRCLWSLHARMEEVRTYAMGRNGLGIDMPTKEPQEPKPIIPPRRVVLPRENQLRRRDFIGESNIEKMWRWDEGALEWTSCNFRETWSKPGINKREKSGGSGGTSGSGGYDGFGMVGVAGKSNIRRWWRVSVRSETSDVESAPIKAGSQAMAKRGGSESWEKDFAGDKSFDRRRKNES